MSTTLVALAQSMQPADVPTIVQTMKDPFTGVTPDFSVFGVKFTNLWQKVFAAAWAIGIIWLGILFVPAIVEFAQHKGGNHPQQMQEARSSVIKTGGALGAMVGLGVILGAIIKIVG